MGSGDVSVVVGFKLSLLLSVVMASVTASSPSTTCFVEDSSIDSDKDVVVGSFVFGGSIDFSVVLSSEGLSVTVACELSLLFSVTTRVSDVDASDVNVTGAVTGIDVVVGSGGVSVGVVFKLSF